MDAPITQLNEDVARLALQVLSYVCFDRQVDWAEGTGRKDDRPKEHSMSYREAISSMVDNFPTLLSCRYQFSVRKERMQGPIFTE